MKRHWYVSDGEQEHFFVLADGPGEALRLVQVEPAGMELFRRIPDPIRILQVASVMSVFLAPFGLVLMTLIELGR